MATYIKTLKEDNGDIVYPQTITDAIYTSGGQTLETEISKYVTAEDIAQSVASFGTVTTGMIDDDAITTAKLNDGSVTASKIDNNAVTTSKIDDGAVTSQKIDWTTIPFYANSSSTDYTLNPSANTVSVTVTQAGDYYILGVGSAYGGTASSFLEAAILQGATELGKNYSTIVADRTNTVVGVVASGVSANTTFTLRLTLGGGSGTTQNRTQSIFAMRIS